MPRDTFQRLRPLREGRGLLLGCGLCLTIAFSLLLIYQPLLIHQAELRLYDTMLTGRAKPPQSPVPVLIGVDEESLQAYGQWPWPRYRLARLVERLNELGATVVALDFLMPEADRTSPEIVLAERQRDKQPVSALTQPASLDSNSRQLADALSRGATVLGFFFNFTDGSVAARKSAPVLPEGMVVNKTTGSDAAWPRPTGIIRNISILTDKVSAEGFTNALHDLDGALRRVPLLMTHEGTSYPSLAMSALLLASPDRTIRLKQRGSETWLAWGDRHIPLDTHGNLLVDFRSAEKPFPYFSAQAILQGTQAPGTLKGKIALVGPWAKGLGDFHLVPSGQFISGLNVHATIIDNILSGKFISRPSWAQGAELFAVLLIGTVSSWLLSRPGFRLSLATVVTASGGCYLGARALLVSKGMYLSPLLPMLTPIIIMTILSLLKYGIEAHKVKQRNRDLIDAQDTIIISMSTLAETRDNETGKHILRTQHYVELLIRKLALFPKYSTLDENTIELIIKSAPLHDIGKVGIPDAILQKPGQLTDDEYAIMKTHTLIGAAALSKTIEGTGHPERQDFLHYAQQMIESHHEHWDGSGYPHGLQGGDIPLAGRLMSVADVYDALVSRRVYKKGLSHEKASELIVQESGRKFDPEVVNAFIATNAEFAAIAREYADASGEELLNSTPSPNRP